MKLYITRDKNKELFLWPMKPTKGISVWYILGTVVKSIRLNSDEFTEVKWEDPEPTEVKLVIKKKV